MAKVEHLPGSELEQLRDKAERDGDEGLVERCNAELDRRAYDAEDPGSPQNLREDTPALDPPGWERR